MLDIWPAFPLVIKGYVYESGLDNIFTVLQRNGNRVCQIDLDGLTKPQLDQVTLAPGTISGTKGRATRRSLRGNVLGQQIVLGRIRTPSSSITLLGSHTVVETTETTFVRDSARPSLPFWHSQF